MTRRNVKNVAASIHQRLLNAAREAGRPFNEFPKNNASANAARPRKPEVHGGCGWLPAR